MYPNRARSVLTSAKLVFRVNFDNFHQTHNKNKILEFSKGTNINSSCVKHKPSEASNSERRENLQFTSFFTTGEHFTRNSKIFQLPMEDLRTVSISSRIVLDLHHFTRDTRKKNVCQPKWRYIKQIKQLELKTMYSRWTWLCRGYWRYRSLIWLIDW